MAVEPNTPVLIRHGQINQRAGDLDALDPVSLMASAAHGAADAAVLRAIDAIRVVNLLSWRYRDPGLLLGQLIGADHPDTFYSGVGGNVPQSLMNQACLDIQTGRREVVMIAGAESWRTRMRLRARGTKPQWPRQDDSIAPAAHGADVPLSGSWEDRIGLDRPAYIYPMFEQAIRISKGISSDEHRKHIGALWSRFSDVAQDNPHAWTRQHYSAEEVWSPSVDNRMISWPYTKLLNSNNMVDQAAVLIVASAQAAHRLRIPRDQWVFPHAGTDAHDTYAIAERASYHQSAAIRIAGRRVLELAGVGIDDVDLIDLYSCFPSAVQVGAAELGLSAADDSRALTVTGGLTFAGGPWNNYVSHSIATMAEWLIRRPGAYGLVTANGGYLTKHSFGVYSAQPPSGRFRWEDVQSVVDREPTCKQVTGWEGIGAVESWTVPFARDGQPEKMFLAVRTPRDGRTLAVVTDRSVAESAVKVDIDGAAVRVHSDGTADLL